MKIHNFNILKEQKLIEWIKSNRLKVLNSGIKFA